MSRLPIEAPRVAGVPGLHWGLRWPGRRSARLVLLQAGLWDPAARRLHDSVVDWCRQNPGRRAVVWVAGTELHQLVCAAEVPLAGQAAVAAYARQLFTHYHGTAAQAWPLATWLGPAGRGACALQGPRAAELMSAMPACPLRPLWMDALRWAVRQAPDLARKAEARLLLVEGELTTRITLRRGRCADVHTARLAQATAAALAEALVAEQARAPAFDVVMGYGLAGEQPRPDGTRVLGSLDGAGPPAEWLAGAWPGLAAGRLPSGRFELGHANRPPRLAWLALACALSVFGTAVQQAHAAWQARQLASAAPRGQAVEAPAAAAAESGYGSAIWEAEAAEVAALAAALHRPWPQWLQGIEAVSGPRVQWLEIEFDAQSEVGWRLRGVARDHRSGLELARELAQQAEWASARLARLQVTQPGAAVPFEIHAPARAGTEAGR